MSRSRAYSLFTAAPAANSSSSSSSPPPTTSAIASSSPSAYDPFLDLGRLLSRLEQNLLRADADRWRRLVSDGFQRQQARFDVAAARTLLTRVEQSAQQIRKVTRRQEVQAELSRRRVLVEQLQERLDDLDEEARSVAALRGAAGGDGGEEDEDDDSEVDEELAFLATLSRPAAAAHSTKPSRPIEPRDNNINQTRGGPDTPGTITSDAGSTATASSASSQPTMTAAATAAAADKTKRKKSGRVRIAASAENDGEATTTTTRMVTRSRKGASRRQTKDTTAYTTSSESTDGPTALFEKSKAGNGLVAEETILDHHRREQEELSGDILRLAHALKEKSMATARMLEDDKDLVDRVGDGMNTTTDSLTAASKSMALLSRMTEGKGWWGRMMLMAMVYGLMVVLVLLFLFLPKLRF